MKFHISSIAYLLSIVLFFNACQTTDQNDRTTQMSRTDSIVGELDSVLTMYHKEDALFGTVLIADAGKVIYTNSFGYANHDTKDMLTPASVFRLASVGKQFTAMCIMILQEQGKLDYDTDFDEYLTELDYPGMTVRHLLWHTSGVANYMAFMLKYYPEEPEYHNDDVVRIMAEQAPERLFEPGEAHQYSNTGYVLLASVVERLSGLTFNEFVQQNIFDKIGMSNSFVPTTNEELAAIPNLVLGYRLNRKTSEFLNNDDNTATTYGDGGIFSNVYDLFKWNEALYTEELAKHETIAEAFKPYVLNNGTVGEYGFGWGVHDVDSNKIVEHSGGWVGFRTKVFRDLTNQHCVIILTNVGNTPGASMHRLCHNMLTGKDNANQYNNFFYGLKSTQKIIDEKKLVFSKMSDELTDKYEGVFINEDFDEEIFIVEEIFVLKEEGELALYGADINFRNYHLPNDSIHFEDPIGNRLDFIFDESGSVTGFILPNKGTFVRKSPDAKFDYLNMVKNTYIAEGTEWKFQYKHGILRVDVPQEGIYVMHAAGDKEFTFDYEEGYKIRFVTNQSNSEIVEVVYIEEGREVVLE